MGKLSFLFIFGVVFFAGGNCCPRHQYYYQVVELPLPAIRDSDYRNRELGKYLVQEIKQQREVRPNTCKDNNSKYIQEVPSDTDHFEGMKMTEIYMHQLEANPKEVFSGVEDTERALRSFCTLNLLMTKDMAVRRFLLQRGTDGDVFEVFMTEEALMTRIARNPEWRTINVVQCTHYLYHIATNYGNRNVSITLVDKEHGGPELFFYHRMDIGGFWKQGCDPASLPHSADPEY